MVLQEVVEALLVEAAEAEFRILEIREESLEIHMAAEVGEVVGKVYMLEMLPNLQLELMEEAVELEEALRILLQMELMEPIQVK